MNIGADRPSLQTRQHGFHLGFDDDLSTNQIQCLFPGSTLPAILCRSGFGVNDCVEGVLPCAGGNTRICSCKVSLGNLEIQMWLPGGFVASVDKRFGFTPILGAEAF